MPATATANTTARAIEPEEAARLALALDYGFHETPFGESLLALVGDALAVLYFVNEEAGYGRADALHAVERRWPFARLAENPARTRAVAARLFDDPASAPSLLMIGTPFETRVWQATREVPMGATTSYGAIARRVGAPKGARAVGGALGRNMLAFVVPCHRICRSDGSIGGFGCGLGRKRAMLAWEGARAPHANRPARSSTSIM